MKPEVAPTRPVYRNEAVYRSAERLLASRSSPPKRNRPVWPLVFLAGLVCGIGLATLWFLPLRSIDTTARKAATRPATGGSALVAAKTPSPPAQRTALPTAPANDTASVGAPAETPAPTLEDQPSPTQSASRALPIHPARSSATAAQSTVVAATLHFSSLLVLHGHQFANMRPPQEVHFLLYPSRGPRGVTVAGSLRYFENGVMVSFHSLVGSIENLTIQLKEVTPAVRGRQAIPRRFEIRIPRDPTSSKFEGRWIQGTESGQLELELLQPF